MKRDVLCQHARLFYERGLMAATGGNMSVRESADHFYISQSGVHKGRLGSADLIPCDLKGAPIISHPGTPSAEVSIHASVYRRSQAQAVYHVHPANWISLTLGNPSSIALPDLEILKVFPKRALRENMELSCFANHDHVPSIAAEVAERMEAEGFDLPAFMINGHGLTVWGDSPEAAFNGVEALMLVGDILAS